MEITKLKRYLLGDVSAPEAEALDLQIIADEISEEELLWAESELTEDFLERKLTASEIEMFEKNFLVSPERRRLVEQTALLKNYAARTPSGIEANKPCQTEQGNFLTKIKDFFSLSLRPATVFAALALVIAAVLTVYYLTANRQTAEEKEFAAVNQTDLSDLARLKDDYAVSLTGGNLRDTNGTANKLSSAKLKDKILFRLALPFLPEKAEVFKIELMRDQKILFTQNNLHFYDNGNGRELRFYLPGASLVKGEYQIKVAKQTAAESTFAYNFAVE